MLLEPRSNPLHAPIELPLERGPRCVRAPRSRMQHEVDGVTFDFLKAEPKQLSKPSPTAGTDDCLPHFSRSGDTITAVRSCFQSSRQGEEQQVPARNPHALAIDLLELSPFSDSAGARDPVSARRQSASGLCAAERSKPSDRPAYAFAPESRVYACAVDYSVEKSFSFQSLPSSWTRHPIPGQCKCQATEASSRLDCGSSIAATYDTLVFFR